jgi:hypothetical protein
MAKERETWLAKLMADFAHSPASGSRSPVASVAEEAHQGADSMVNLAS